jgi:hypothetical protein
LGAVSSRHLGEHDETIRWLQKFVWNAPKSGSTLVQIFIDLKNINGPFKREILYIILIQSGMSGNLVWLS